MSNEKLIFFFILTFHKYKRDVYNVSKHVQGEFPQYKCLKTL